MTGGRRTAGVSVAAVRKGILSCMNSVPAMLMATSRAARSTFVKSLDNLPEAILVAIQHDHFLFMTSLHCVVKTSGLSDGTEDGNRYFSVLYNCVRVLCLHKCVDQPVRGTRTHRHNICFIGAVSLRPDTGPCVACRIINIRMRGAVVLVHAGLAQR